MAPAITPPLVRLQALTIKARCPVRGLKGWCWLYSGTLKDNGYAAVLRGGRGSGMVYIHRLSYEIHVGPIPKGQIIDHLCRVRHCWNPAHLEAVTHQENLHRGQHPNILRHLSKTCIRGHDLRIHGRKRTDRAGYRCGECIRIRYRERAA